jgi:hypothetical protein
MKNWIVAVLCGVLFSAVALPATNNDSRDEKAVMATLEDMAQATIKKDVATLDKIYHPDLTYSHSSAMLQSYRVDDVPRLYHQDLRQCRAGARR